MGEDDVYLYLLMRFSDLDSMNPGKAVAQGAHAANQMVHTINRENQTHMRWLDLWQGSTPGGFGTTITLDVPGTRLNLVTEWAKTLTLHAGVTHDPTYPLLDGPTLHLIP
ncbi:peptidyl-tRNA hydrolase, partial [Corallococcus praedator]|uniref:peptidyl-tRNA hydrolase n=1 Tax=Corallococcus praedator TaxID=2316724 RepID=UPI001ABF3C89